MDLRKLGLAAPRGLYPITKRHLRVHQDLVRTQSRRLLHRPAHLGTANNPHPPNAQQGTWSLQIQGMAIYRQLAGFLRSPRSRVIWIPKHPYPQRKVLQVRHEPNHSLRPLSLPAACQHRAQAGCRPCPPQHAPTLVCTSRTTRNKEIGLVPVQMIRVVDCADQDRASTDLGRYGWRRCGQGRPQRSGGRIEAIAEAYIASSP